MPTVTNLPPVTIASERVGLLGQIADKLNHRNPDLAGRLMDELARARVVPESALPPDVVDLGRRVTYRDLSSGREQVVILVEPGDADIGEGKVSIATPVGIALIGLAAGALFDWDDRSGRNRELAVLSVAQAG